MTRYSSLNGLEQFVDPRSPQYVTKKAKQFSSESCHGLCFRARFRPNWDVNLEAVFSLTSET